MDELQSTPAREDGVANEISDGTTGACVGTEIAFAPSWERWNTFVLPFSANCAYSRSCDRRSQVGAASGAHFAWAMRLHRSHMTAFFFTLPTHTLQTIAVDVR